jgi:perosamine synthetase
MANFINVSQPDLGQAESDAVQAVLASHWVGMGPKTAAFEAALAERLGVRHVIATSSCTAALHLALANLKPDGRNEIIVPSLTFAATIQAVRLAGFDPVFAEVNPRTLTIDFEDVERLLNRETRAIVPVHFAGYPCDMDSLRQLAGRRGVDIVSDGAHAFGSTIGGVAIGRQGTATCFSFSSNKNITCGEGGAVATQSDYLAARVKKSRFLGISHHTWERRKRAKPWQYTVVGPGFRYHMSDINAAIGLAQLERLDEFARTRRAIAARYDSRLAGLPWLLPVERDLENTIPQLYVTRITHGLRDRLFTSLRADGINCGVHYVPNHQQPAFKKFKRSLPVTERLADEIISLPLHTRLRADQIEQVISKVGHFLRGALPAKHRRKSPSQLAI